MKVSRGKVHKYLGMTLDFTTKGQVKISMVDYVKEVVDAWDLAPQLDNDGFATVKSRHGTKAKNVGEPPEGSRFFKHTLFRSF